MWVGFFFIYFIYMYIHMRMSFQISLYIYSLYYIYTGFPCSSVGKESACKAEESDLSVGSGRFPWRRKWQPTPVCLPGESHGQRSLVGYLQSIGLERVGHDLVTKPPYIHMCLCVCVCVCVYIYIHTHMYLLIN